MSRVRIAAKEVGAKGTAPRRTSATANTGAADSRKPSQSRSRASLDRMVSTAHKLMVERQGEDFTLQDVSVLGEVSIGSIYFRFKNKDDLVRAVISQELAQMAQDEVSAVEQTLQNSSSLADYIPAYVRNFAEILRSHSLMLRMAMRRAATDPTMSEAGERHELAASLRLANSIAHYRDQIPGDTESRAKVAFHLLFATIARHLSLDWHSPSANRIEWDFLLDEMSAMLLAYFTAPEGRR